ncbi:MAG: hypothetical protein LAT76_09270 [Schleiferiaceae bacterium]|nr:hypothetical protein [Schleiferiaceae bacterium]
MTARFVVYLGLLLVISSAGLFWVRQHKVASPFSVLVAFITLVFLGEIIAKLMALQYRYNAPIYHIISWCHVGTLCLLYSKQFKGSRKKIILSLSLFTLLCCIIISTFWNGFTRFPITNLALLSILGIGFALFHFLQMLQHPTSTPLLSEPMFWINTIHLIFFGVTFFSWPFLSGYFEMPKWDVYLLYFANILLYSGYFRAIYLSKTPAK